MDAIHTKDNAETSNDAPVQVIPHQVWPLRAVCGPKTTRKCVSNRHRETHHHKRIVRVCESNSVQLFFASVARERHRYLQLQEVEEVRGAEREAEFQKPFELLQVELGAHLFY